MFSQELLDILKQVITSWQVIFITIALVLFYLIFSNAAKTNRRPREKKVKIKKSKKKDDLAAGPVAAESADNTNDELGLEEA